MANIGYELAKRLKEAGFDQHTKEIGAQYVFRDPEDYDDRCYLPDLGELIAAIVGDKPNSFYLDFNDEWSVYDEPNLKGMWRARYYPGTPVGFCEAVGETPEEAVSLLWLAINGK